MAKLNEYPRIKKLVSLEDHNRRRRAQWGALQIPGGNGIACPECGLELFDVRGFELTSNPPQRMVRCNCGYRGTRVS